MLLVYNFNKLPIRVKYYIYDKSLCVNTKHPLKMILCAFDKNFSIEMGNTLKLYK